MRYADTLLAEGEVVIHRARRHWLSVFLEARAALALWLATLVLMAAVVLLRLTPPVSDWLSIAALAFLLLGLLIFGYRLWQWWAEDFLITNRRLMKVTGILNKSSSDSSLEKINDAILHQNVIGRVLNYGDMDIVTASGEMAVDYFRMLHGAKQFKRLMLNQKHALELEYRYAASAPSPPFRATPVNMLGESAEPSRSVPAEPRTPTPAPAAARDVVEPDAAERPAGRADASAEWGLPAEPSQPPAWSEPPEPTEPPERTEPHTESREPNTDRSLEITQTLARLADLRDRGAISAEDYETKKNELLRRL